VKASEEKHTFHIHEYTYDQYGLAIKISNFHPDKEDVKAYITIKADLDKNPDLEGSHLKLQHQNLTSANARKSFVKIMAEDFPSFPWADIMEYICTKSTLKYWEGAPVIKIGKQRKRTEVPYLLYPVVRKDAPCIIYGSGGIGKSYVSLYFSMLVQHSLSVGTLVPQQSNVLYLDYESGDEDLNDRLAAMAKGLNIDVEINYRYCHQPLAQDVEALGEIIAEQNVGMVIVDAKGAAVGGWINEARQTMDMFNSLRSLDVTSIIIDHVSKENSNAPIGSVYNFNEARNIWEMRSSQAEESDRMKIGLYHKKTNVGKLHRDFGLEFVFQDDESGNIDTVWVNETETTSDPVLRKGKNIYDQIAYLLNHSTDMSGAYRSLSIDEIANSIGEKQSTVTSRISDRVGDYGYWERKSKGLYIYKPKLEDQVEW
jgi:RNAse (barnase) inhibitor barstar